MDTILLFKKDLDRYSTDSLGTLQRHFDLPATKRADLLWLLAIYQAQNNRQGTMHGAAQPPDIESIQTFDMDDVSAQPVLNSAGTQIVTVRGNTAKIWDVETGKVVRTLTGHQDLVNDAAFNDDGSLVVTVSDDDTAKIWEVESGEELRTLRGHTDGVFDAVVNDDLVLTVSMDGTAKIWDIYSGEELRTLQHDGISHGGFSGDGNLIVTVSTPGRLSSWEQAHGITKQVGIVRVWDVETGEVVNTIRDAWDMGWGWIVVSSGDLIVARSGDGAARIWDIKGGDVVQTLQPERATTPPSIIYRKYDIKTAVPNHEGTQVVTTDGRNTAKIWDIKTGELVHTLTGHADKVNAAVFDRDGSLVLTVSEDRTAKIWDVYSGTELRTLTGHDAWVMEGAFNDIGTRVITSDMAGIIKIWSTGRAVKGGRATMNGAPEPIQTLLHFRGVESATFNNDGTQVVTVSKDGKARIWDTRSGVELQTLPANSAVFNDDGTLVVTALDDGTAEIWDVESGEKLHTLEGHTDQVNNAVFNRAGTQVVTASRDREAKIWNVETGDLVQTLQGDFGIADAVGNVTNAVFNDDGTLVVTADGTARIWDVERGYLVHTLHTTQVSNAVFNDDGTLVVTTAGAEGRRREASDDGTAKIWDVQSGDLVHTLEGHTDQVNNAVFNHDGTLVVTASRDGTAKLWDVDSGEELHTLRHHDAIRSAVFNDDGTLVVTASDDRTARIWDVSTGDLVQILRGHRGGVESAVFNRDGSLVVTASSDDTAMIWPTGLGMVKAARKRGTMNGAPRPLFSDVLSAPRGAPSPREVVGDICANLILRGGTLGQRDIKSINDYIDHTKEAGSVEIPLIDNTPAGIRKTCDPLLRDIISVIDPDTNTARMNTQNLARRYQKISEEQSSEQAAAEETAEEAAAKEAFDEMKRKVLIAKVELRNRYKNELRLQYANTVICTQAPVINVHNIPYVTNNELEGRRCIIPMKMWTKIFEHDIDQQVFLEMSAIERGAFGTIREKRYLKIEGPHYDDDTIQVSPLVSDEFAIFSTKVASFRDCSINLIKLIEMKLLRDPGPISDVDDAIIKELLANQLDQLGVPMVGDILNVKANGYELAYQITQITDTEGSSVLAAAAAKIGVDVDLLFTVQTKEELLFELGGEVWGIEDPMYDSLI